MKEAIRQRAIDLGFDLCRFTTAAPPASGEHLQHWLAHSHHGEMSYLQRNAAKRMDPQLVLPGAKTVICLAASYFRPETPARSDTGSFMRAVIARYARHEDYHDVLAKRLRDLARFVDEANHGRSRSLWYVDTGPVLERDLAQRAGIGFIGKHTNLISRKLGNWILLSEILTTAELEPDEPEVNRCGSCVRCIGACPTRAITAPFQLDARLCISYLTIELKGAIPVELRPLIGNRIFGCDDCLAACPWNRFAREGQLMKCNARAGLGTLDLIELLNLDEAGLKELFRGTPMLRAKRRGFLRNVCVALGNTGDARALPALLRASADPEPLIAEHARWAIGQIKARQAGEPP